MTGVEVGVLHFPASQMQFSLQLFCLQSFSVLNFAPSIFPVIGFNECASQEVGQI